MKIIITQIIVLCISMNVIGQGIKYRLTLKDTCQNTTETHFSYWIFKDTVELQNRTFPNVEWVYSDEGDSMDFYAVLSDTGTYFISHGYYDGIPNRNYFHKVNIREYGFFNDTIELAYFYSFNHYNYNPSFTKYYCCQEECNGFHSSYYENGNKKLEGHFENGFPIGDLNKYYYNGQIRERHLYKKRLRKKSYFDFDGEIKKEFTLKHIKEYPFWIYQERKWYWKNGQVKKHSIYKGWNLIKEYEYNKEGRIICQIKNKTRREYYSNGKIKSKIQWKKQIIPIYCAEKLMFWKKDCYCCDDYDYTIKVTEYDIQGNLKVKGKFNFWANERMDKFDKIDNFDWIIDYKEFENGELVRIIKNKGIEILQKGNTNDSKDQ